MKIVGMIGRTEKNFGPFEDGETAAEALRSNGWVLDERVGVWHHPEHPEAGEAVVLPLLPPEALQES